jgi:hypothetical protein
MQDALCLKEGNAMSTCIEPVHRPDRDQSRPPGQHNQVVVKVNAEVDEYIASLVRALNEFDGVLTLDSCQGDSLMMAYVYFTRCGTSRDLVRFVDELAATLSARLAAREDEYEIRLEWTAGTERPLAVLRTRTDYVDELAAALIGVASTLKKQPPCSK